MEKASTASSAIDALYDVDKNDSAEYIREDLRETVMRESFLSLKGFFENPRAVNDSDNSENEDLIHCRTELEREIRKTEQKMKSCLEHLRNLCQTRNNSEKISFEQANIFVYFVETFALQGSGSRNKKISPKLKQYFAFFYTRDDCNVIGNVRTALLHNPTMKISLDDIPKFIEKDLKYFFDSLKKYVEEVYNKSSSNECLKQMFILEDMLENQNFNDSEAGLEKLVMAAHRDINRQSESQIFTNEEISSLIQKLKQTSGPQNILSEIKTCLKNKIELIQKSRDQSNKESESNKKVTEKERIKGRKSKREVTAGNKSEKSESPSEVTAKTGCRNSEIDLSSFLKSIHKKDVWMLIPSSEEKEITIGIHLNDVKSFLKEEFEKLIKATYGEQKDLPEKLFNFVTNFCPALQEERGKDFKELLDFRNEIMHEFYKYGYTEFGRNLYMMRSILFRYYFAQEAGEVLKAVKPTEISKTICSSLEFKLNDFQNEFGNLELVIPENQEKDYFGFKFFKNFYPEKDDDDAETLIHQYLRFMSIIETENRERESLMDIERENSQEEQVQYEEINDTKRREIFENFIRLIKTKTYCSNLYDAEKMNFGRELADTYGVNTTHFNNVCATFIEKDEEFAEEDKDPIKKIVEDVNELKRIKDRYKLSSQAFIFFCDQSLRKQKTTLASMVSKDSFEGIDPKVQREIRNILQDESSIHIKIGDALVSLKKSEAICNMLKVFYSAYHEYQAKFNIEEIFNDGIFLDYLTRTEQDDNSFRICAVIQKLLQIKFTAPYVARLIVKNPSDDVVENEDFSKLLEILLKEPGGAYMNHLHLVLNETGSTNLNPYHKICQIICNGNIDIESMDTVFSQPKHVKEILIGLENRIPKFDFSRSRENKVVKLTKKVLKFLNNTSYELYKKGNYDDALKILDDSLNVYETLINSSLMEANEVQVLMARYRRARIKNKQGNMKKVDTDKKVLHDEACEIFERIKKILVGELNSDAVTEVRDTEIERITIFLLASHDLAYTYHLLDKYKESCETYVILFQEIIKFCLPPIDKNVLSTEFLNLETYEKIKASENYKKIVCFSDESKKYLDILKIMCSIAYVKVSCGKIAHKNYASAKRYYDEALEIYTKAFSCRNKNLAVSESSVIRILRQISYVIHRIAWILPKIEFENDSDTGGSQQDCCETVLCYSYLSLVKNTFLYKMQKEMYWPSHPAVVKSISNMIRSIHNIAFVYNTIGSKKSGKKNKEHHNKALEMYLKIDEFLSSGVGEKEHLKWKNSRDIAYTYNELGNKKTAREWLVSVLRKQKKLLGRDHKETLKTEEMFQKLNLK